MDVLLLVLLLFLAMVIFVIFRGFTIKILARHGKKIPAVIIKTRTFNFASGGTHQRYRYEYFVKNKHYAGSSFLTQIAPSFDIYFIPRFPFLSAPAPLVEKVQQHYRAKNDL